MPNHRSDIAEVRAAMRAVGYTILQVEPRLENLSNLRPDVLAWASNADGELVPWAVVEYKNKKLRQPELVLPSLAGSRDLLGTLEHYAVINGQWFKADRGVRSLQPVDGPTPPEHGSQGLVTDRSLATSLLVQRLWFEADRLRNSGVSAERYFPSGDVLTSSPEWEAGYRTARRWVRAGSGRRTLAREAGRADRVRLSWQTPRVQLTPSGCLRRFGAG
jgi:hypothetical protein